MLGSSVEILGALKQRKFALAE